MAYADVEKLGYLDLKNKQPGKVSALIERWFGEKRGLDSGIHGLVSAREFTFLAQRFAQRSIIKDISMVPVQIGSDVESRLRCIRGLRSHLMNDEAVGKVAEIFQFSAQERDAAQSEFYAARDADRADWRQFLQEKALAATNLLDLATIAAVQQGFKSLSAMLGHMYDDIATPEMMTKGSFVTKIQAQLAEGNVAPSVLKHLREHSAEPVQNHLDTLVSQAADVLKEKGVQPNNDSSLKPVGRGKRSGVDAEVRAAVKYRDGVRNEFWLRFKGICQALQVDEQALMVRAMGDMKMDSEEAMQPLQFKEKIGFNWPDWIDDTTYERLITALRFAGHEDRRSPHIFKEVKVMLYSLNPNKAIVVDGLEAALNKLYAEGSKEISGQEALPAERKAARG